MFTLIFIVAIVLVLGILIAKRDVRLVRESEKMRRTLVQDYGRTEFNHSGKGLAIPYHVLPGGKQ